MIRYQRRLEEEFHEEFVGLSLHRTLYQLILRQNTKLVDKMKSEFKVPDKRFWYLKVEALGEKGLWEDIGKMVKEKKKPPIPFEVKHFLMLRLFLMNHCLCKKVPQRPTLS